MTWRHSLFGLEIRSEVNLGNALAALADADVEVRLGTVPDHLEGGRRYNPLNEVAPGRLLLTMPKVARYLVSEGREIVVEPAPESDERSLAIFTSVSPLAGILHQRRQVCLHGSAVATSKGAVVFMAPAGVGKSTIAAALAARGYDLVTDDIAPIGDHDGRGWMVALGPARLKLWPDSLEALAVDATPLATVRPGLEKRFLPVERRGSGAIPVAALCALRLGQGEHVEISRLAMREALEALMFNTFRRRMQAAVDAQHENFRRVARIAAEVPCFSVVRPSQAFSLSDLADSIEGLVAKL